MSKTPPQYALIKWQGGPDDGKFTPGIPIEWIKNFKYEEFMESDMDDMDDISYVVEWRNKSKEPLGGWTCYNGLVMAVSEHKKNLEVILKSLRGVPSPKMKIGKNNEVMPITKPGCSTSSQSASEVVIPQNHEKCDEKSEKAEVSIDKQAEVSSDEDHDQSDGASRSVRRVYVNAKKTLSNNSGLPTNGKAISEKTSPTGSRDSTDKKLIAPHKIPEKEAQSSDSSLLKEVINERTDLGIKLSGISTLPIQSDKAGDDKQKPITLEDVVKCITQVLQNQQKTDNSNSDGNQGNSRTMSTREKKKQDREVELGNEGSGVFLKESQFQYAQKRPTPTAMATCLVDLLFKLEVLLVSNLKGGKRKVKGSDDANAPQHKALDENILQAIRVEVERQHPSTYNYANIGQAINRHLNYLRSQQKDKKGKS